MVYVRDFSSFNGPTVILIYPGHVQNTCGFCEVCPVVSIHWAMNPLVKHESSCDGWHFSSVLVSVERVRVSGAVAWKWASHWVWPQGTEYHTRRPAKPAFHHLPEDYCNVSPRAGSYSTLPQMTKSPRPFPPYEHTASDKNTDSLPYYLRATFQSINQNHKPFTEIGNGLRWKSLEFTPLRECLLNASLHRGGDAKKLPALSTEGTVRSISLLAAWKTENLEHNHCAMEQTSTVWNCWGSLHSC